MKCKFDVKKVTLIVLVVVALGMVWAMSTGYVAVSESFKVNEHAGFLGDIKNDSCTPIVKSVEKGEKCIVAFHGDFCGHCKAMKPAWNQFYTAWYGQIVDGKKLRIYALESARTKAMKDFNRRFGFNGVEGYPTILSCSIENGKPVVKEYNGARSVAGFKGFCKA
tara:strand:- start:10 stop:504 length:495 start_codon:yes stop_codon:yes gene_type:complete